MSNDYIRRHDVMDLWSKYRPTIAVDAIEYDMQLKRLPSADVVQVAHSEWIYHMSFGVCKKCGYEYEWKGTDAKNYCPRCGAKMRGEQE